MRVNLVFKHTFKTAKLDDRMESREKCEQIISMFNNKPLGGPGPGSYQPLVVKFADGGTSRRKTAVSSPDPTWSGQASTDGSVSVMSHPSELSI